MKASNIRRTFLEFFASKGHVVVPSGSLIPNDPTLQFVNAGMVPFKDVFTGKETRGYKRATSSQKCVRISGKHNDLENVGQTARHHTFFEMLGNFSFGDYFKEDAIAFAWELFTDVFDLPRERLVATVFAGEDGVAADDEARALWRKVAGLPDERIIGLGKSDNFWQMGDTGPCGPCSELHYWFGPVPEGGVPYHLFNRQEPSPDGRGWVELWNLVFMQFERATKEGPLTPLPAPSIDTGAGLERLAAVLQGVTSNYDTDLLRPLVERAAAIANKPYGGTQSPDDMSMRVIADHARMAAFSIAEGVTPDRVGRPYVLRRVLRRAIRHGHRLGIERPFLHEVALEVVSRMGADYPELEERRATIAATIEQEEIGFRETIGRGLSLLEAELEKPEVASAKLLGGKVAFDLYDTYGFPLDLTQVIADERGVKVDEVGYNSELEAAKRRSRGVGVLNKDQATQKAYYDAAELLTNKSVEFLGYEAEEGEAVVKAIVVDGELVDHVAWEGGTGPLPTLDLIVDRTPFYGRSGGQEGDSGEVRALEGGGRLTVTNTTKPASVPGLVVHHGVLAQGRLAVGDRVGLYVDHDRRSATRRNHSATHLLHWALGHVLGEHVEQRGSLVAPDVLRFDFSHGKPLTPGEIERVEDLVNAKVLANEAVLTRVLPIAEAKQSGAKAIFGEKYGDVVRVLTMTDDSIEFCGGTHVRALGDIGLFKIVSEGGVAAGVRRVEAVTGLNALAHVRDEERLLRDVAAAAKTPGNRPRVEAIAGLVERVRELEKQNRDLTRKAAMGGASAAGAPGASATGPAPHEVGGVKVLAVQTEVADAATLRELAEHHRDRLGEAVVLVGSAAAGKAMLVLAVSKSLTGKLKAGELIRPVAALVGGSGGGRPDMAQAGGPEVGKLAEALAGLDAAVGKALGVGAS